jgi:hypothetical protein
LLQTVCVSGSNAIESAQIIVRAFAFRKDMSLRVHCVANLVRFDHGFYRSGLACVSGADDPLNAAQHLCQISQQADRIAELHEAGLLSIGEQEGAIEFGIDDEVAVSGMRAVFIRVEPERIVVERRVAQTHQKLHLGRS